MKPRKNLKVSIIIPTLNNASVLKDFFFALQKQSYPKKYIEYLVIDGGSKDKTKQISRQFGAEIFHNKQVLAEPGVSLGINKAKGDIVMILAVDNFFADDTAIKKIVDIFSNEKIAAIFPKHDSTSDDTIFSKYVNTFTDPFNHFVYGYGANGRTFQKQYKTIKHTKIYDVYDFASSSVPPIIAFAQGFTIRRKYKRTKKDFYDDIEPIIRLAKEGKYIAYAHDISLYHHTIRNINHFIRKQRWATKNALDKKAYGIAYRAQTLSQKQKLKIAIWPVYAFSIVFPFIRSVYGAISDKELLWLIHPYMCFISAAASFTEVAVYSINKQRKISRQ